MKNVRYIVLGLLLSTTLSVSARMYKAGEKVYINAVQSDGLGDWSQANAKLFLYFYQSTNTSNSEWVALSRVGTSNLFEGTLNPYHPWYDRVSVIRKSPSGTINNWSDRWNQSCDIIIPDNSGCNYLNEFYKKEKLDDDCGGSMSYMWFYHPLADPTSASVTTIDQADREVMEVCTQSVGDPLSLQPRIAHKPKPDDYDYYDYEQVRAWFKWDGSKWQELANSHNNWGFDGPSGLNETIGAANSHSYYFLSTSDHSKQRFIEVAVTKDCSPTCEITDFGVVTSNVNAHDSTFVLDGIVAFKDATGQNLRISVTDAKGEHHIDYMNPTTPHIFSLKGLYADGKSGVTAKAEFLGTPYSATTSFNAPNAITGISTSVINKAQGESTTLTPATPGTDGFIWHDGNTADHERIIPAYNFDTSVVCTYYEYEKAPEVGGNLIKNGDFSANPFDYGTTHYKLDIIGSNISEYNFWGKDVTSSSNFYDKHKDGDNAISGGMAIVKSANVFWKRYTKKITPKENTHFALFDADNSGSKKAWYIVTGTTQPDLKLAKGTNYMFSFWVANINNYGEMNNAAILQFAIRYKQGGSWSAEELLGNPIDLNDYMDNIWHQNSYVYTSPVDADEVEIMVRDLNTNGNPGGNDFALDDIQFQPISVVSQAIKHCQRFVVNIFEPAVTVNKPVITITQTPACGKTDFEMQVTVSYSTLNNKYPVSLQLTDNIYGDLFTTPLPIDPAVNPNSITLTLPTSAYPMLVADGKVHTLTATIIRKDGHGVDKGGQNSNTYTSPGIPAINTPVLTELLKVCDKTTYDLEVATEYVAFKGTKLHYDWDGVEWTDAENPSLSYKEVTPQTATGTLHNLPADGKTHTLRVYSDNAALDCEYTVNPVTAPYMPQVSATATVQPYSCGDPNYQVKVEATFANGQGHKLIFEDWKGNKQTLTTESTDTKKEYTFAYAWETPATHAYKVYFEGAETCAEYSDAHKPSFTSPVEPKIENVAYDITSVTSCGITTYDLSVTFDYYNQDGTLSVDVDGTPASGITPAFVANSTTKQSATATFTGLSADGNTHAITVKTTGGLHNCTAGPVNFTAPTTPSMTISAVTPALAACATSASVTFDVTYTYQQGKMRYWIDDQPYATKTISEKNTAPLTVNGLSIPSFDADGKTHTIHVQFDGANSCEDSIAFTAPLSQAISSVAVTGVPDNILCGQTSYTATVTVTLPYYNAIGKNLVLSFEGKDSTITLTSNPYVALVTLTSADTKGLSMTAHLSDAPTCITPSNNYDTPTRLSCIKDTKTVCEGESYLWPVTNKTYGPFTKVGTDTIVSTVNIHDSLFVTVHPHPEIALTPIDTLYEDITEIRLPYAETNGTPNLFDVTLNSVTVSQKRSAVDTIVIAKPAGVTTGDYTVSVKVRDSLFTCYTTENISIHIAGIPTVSALTVTPRAVDCDATSYIADVHMEYMNARGDLIVEDKTEGKKYSYPVPAAPYNTPQTLDTTITFTSFTPATRNWEAYFNGWASANATSVAPVVPTADIMNVTPAAPDCNKQTSVSFHVDYINQSGQLVYWVDTPPYATLAITENSATIESTDTLSVTNVAADGKQHMLHILFDGANSCEDSIPFTAALSQVIDSIVVSGVPATILCDETCYNANIAVHMPFDATGKNIVISYEGKTATIPVSGNPTTTTLSFTTADATGLSVSASYTDALTCIATSNYFDAPKRWSCDKDTAHICLSDSYKWHGNTYTPATSGAYDYTDNYDQLHLVVHDQPQISLLATDIICDSENEIRLPFAVSQGTPNKLGVVIGSHSFDYIPGTSDTIVLTRPADVVAGTYTATVTVHDTLVTCNSQAQTTFIIAAGDIMYSKWTDLLFIDNSSNRFVEYQWFENGVEMTGETQQRLYQPGGLSGTYFCRMTTTDSLTIYTCEKSFNEVTPSRTINGEDAQVTSTTVYDPMGRIIQGTPSNGIYIILEEVNGEKRARKIAIYE